MELTPEQAQKILDDKPDYMPSDLSQAITEIMPNVTIIISHLEEPNGTPLLTQVTSFMGEFSDDFVEALMLHLRGHIAQVLNEGGVL